MTRHALLAMTLVACAKAAPSEVPSRGEQRTFRGRIASQVDQHMVTTIAGKTLAYFDVANGGQMVIYVEEVPACPGDVELVGKLMVLHGRSKNPKLDAGFTEDELDVDSYRCL